MTTRTIQFFFLSFHFIFIVVAIVWNCSLRIFVFYANRQSQNRIIKLVTKGRENERDVKYTEISIRNTEIIVYR